MPVYEVVKAAGLQYPVGHRFTTSNLHSAMKAHVQLVRDGADNVGPAPVTLEQDFTLAEGLDGSTFEEANALNVLHGKNQTVNTDPEKTKEAPEPKPKPEPKAKATPGPGANS